MDPGENVEERSVEAEIRRKKNGPERRLYLLPKHKS